MVFVPTPVLPEWLLLPGAVGPSRARGGPSVRHAGSGVLARLEVSSCDERHLAVLCPCLLL